MTKEKKYVRNSLLNKTYWRPKIKKAYYSKKRECSKEFGLKINSIIGQMHEISKLPVTDENKKTFVDLTKQLTSLRNETNFKKDFPTFNSFYKYVTSKELDLSINELEEVLTI